MGGGMMNNRHTVTITTECGWVFTLPKVKIWPVVEVEPEVTQEVIRIPTLKVEPRDEQPRGPGKKRRYRKQPYQVMVSYRNANNIFQNIAYISSLNRWCRDNCQHQWVGCNPMFDDVWFSFKTLEDAVAFKLYTNGTLTEERFLPGKKRESVTVEFTA
jgi:hypothetical protein